MRFSGKMCLKIILKVTENQFFSLSLEDRLFGKPQGGAKLIIISGFRVNTMLKDPESYISMPSDKMALVSFIKAKNH